MQKFFQKLIIGVVLFVVIIALMLAIGFGISYILKYIPCELLLYAETGLLFIIVLLVALVVERSNNG